MSDSPADAGAPIVKKSRRTNGKGANGKNGHASGVTSESVSVEPIVSAESSVIAQTEEVVQVVFEAPVVVEASELASSTPSPEPEVAPEASQVSATPASVPPLPPKALPWFTVLPNAHASPPEGFEALPPSLVYSAEANDFAAVEGMAADVREWGGGVDMIILRPKHAMRVRLFDGSLVEVPPKTPIAVPAVNELMGLLSQMQEHPKEGFAVWFVPTISRRLENGREIVHYRGTWNRTGVPRHMLWLDVTG